MGKALVIVESPAKAKTINKYLGSNYIVKSSVGHIRRLATDEYSNKNKIPPEQRKQEQLIVKLGFNPYDGEWKGKYVIDEGKKKVVDELKYQAKHCDCIYLASDLDREGEAIAWHLREVLGKHQYHRVTFNEITQKAIQEAFQHPGEINLNMVHAQMTRQFTDKLVGFTVSPILWKKVGKGLSAGRVQSVAVRLVVEREQEINAFIPKEYWEIDALTTSDKQQPIKFNILKYKGEKLDIQNEAEAQQAKAYLEKVPYQIVDINTKPTTSKPSPPFTTSTLQQAASTRLGYGVKRTMTLAQKLYEAGYITYMRTDSTNISKDALDAVRATISSQYGCKYLPEKPTFYASKNNAQEAHEAIRPSDLNKRGKDLKDIDEDGVKLYNLIWARFVACQMTPAIYDSTTITVKAGDYEGKAKGRVTIFDGWTKVMPQKNDKPEEQPLPEVSLETTLTLNQVETRQCFTKPPARYNEASLVKELEKRGIGRPSTYATIITTIQERGYVKIEQQRFHATKMGEIVTARLMGSFPELMNYDFTANMEDNLDKIAEGQLAWKHTLDDFFKHLDERCQLAILPADAGGMKDTLNKSLNVSCPHCKRPMVLRTSSNGMFLGCSGYGDKENPCRATLPLYPQEKDETEKADRCPQCNKKTESYLIDDKRKLVTCSDTEHCGHHQLIEGQFGHGDTLQHHCDKCHFLMVKRMGRFGEYMNCPSCGNNRTLNKDGTLAPPKVPAVDLPELKCKAKGAHYVFRETKNGGFFLSAHNYPKCREARAMTVEEFKRFSNKLPDKFQYVVQAPSTDSEGLPNVVRFTREDNTPFVVGLQKDGKPGKERWYYREGIWTS